MNKRKLGYVAGINFRALKQEHLPLLCPFQQLSIYFYTPQTHIYNCRVLWVPSFSCMSVHVYVSLYIQTSTFPYSLNSWTKTYLCKVLGNLPSSFQHIGTCLSFTLASVLSNSRLPHLRPWTACLCHPPPANASLHRLPTHLDTHSWYTKSSVHYRRKCSLLAIVLSAFVWCAWKPDCASRTGLFKADFTWCRWSFRYFNTVKKIMAVNL